MGKFALRGVALFYLAAILLAPLGLVVWHTFRYDAHDAWIALTDHNTLHAFQMTLIAVGISVPLNAVFGIAVALAIVRGRFPGKGLLNAFVDLPLALSPVVVGVALFLLYGRTGWLSGFHVLFSLPAIVLASIFVSLPFVAREVVPTLREVGDEQEQAAHTLGASPWQTFWRVTLPSIRWAVVYGVVLTTARCLGEYGAVAVVSGNIEGKTQTATLAVQDAYENLDHAGAYAISLALALIAVVVLVVMTAVRPREGH
ncbi:MAG: sulfate ABC transporter permease [Actinobacteria bacterium]|nr:sulfate ABC transporter permease [Actinomycetota bacterium]MBV8396212.1 sulfate ABC transporter permease [Actinomycetota bacterium]